MFQLSPFEFLLIKLVAHGLKMQSFLLNVNMFVKTKRSVWMQYRQDMASKGRQRSLCTESPIQEEKSRQTDVSEW